MVHDQNLPGETDRPASETTKPTSDESREVSQSRGSGKRSTSAKATASSQRNSLETCVTHGRVRARVLPTKPFACITNIAVSLERNHSDNPLGWYPAATFRPSDLESLLYVVQLLRVQLGGDGCENTNARSTDDVAETILAGDGSHRIGHETALAAGSGVIDLSVSMRYVSESQPYRDNARLTKLTDAAEHAVTVAPVVEEPEKLLSEGDSAKSPNIVLATSTNSSDHASLAADAVRETNVSPGVSSVTDESLATKEVNQSQATETPKVEPTKPMSNKPGGQKRVRSKSAMRSSAGPAGIGEGKKAIRGDSKSVPGTRRKDDREKPRAKPPLPANSRLAAALTTRTRTR